MGILEGRAQNRSDIAQDQANSLDVELSTPTHMASGLYVNIPNAALYACNLGSPFAKRPANTEVW